MTGGQLANIQLQCGHLNRVSGMYSGQLIGFGALYSNIYGYNFSTGESNDEWRALYGGVMTNSNSGASVIPEDHANSLLWQRVNNGEMPPGNNPDLSSDEINLIAQWIDEGALEVNNIDCYADDGTEGVELWDECYSIENTTELYLEDNGLTGEIPPEIGNLTNLIRLFLRNNQLTGEIPESICDLNIEWVNYFDIYNNQLCPPYPSCIEDYVGQQDCQENSISEQPVPITYNLSSPCLLYTSPSPRDGLLSRMPSSA